MRWLRPGFWGSRCALAGSLLVVLAVTDARAQTAGRISGIVRDESGAILPGVTVTIKEVNTAVTRTIITNELGRYAAPQVAPGSYEIVAELAGFQTLIRQGITLTVGQDAAIDLNMKVGAVAETIQVTGEAPIVQTANAQVAGLVDSRQMVDLPLNGRSFETLAFLQPGTTFYFGPRTPEVGTGTRMTVTGSRLQSNSFLLDGTFINEANGLTPGSASGQLLGVDTLREFRVVTSNFGAEYGRTAGGIVEAVTKSGTNALRGSLFEFHRNSAFDAKNFFDPWDEAIPEFVRNQFGGTVGGPIQKDKLWFFGSYEGLRERKGITRIATVPDERMHQGFIGSQFVGVADSMKPYLALYPLPNGRRFANGTGEYVSTNDRTAWENYAMGKVDYSPSQNHSLFARYTVTKSRQVNPQDIPIWEQNDEVFNQYVTAQYTRIFSQSFLGVFRFGLNRSYGVTRVTELVDLAPLYFIPRVSLFGQISVAASNISRIGVFPRYPRVFRHTRPQFSGDLTYTAASHLVKIGVAVDRYLDFRDLVTASGKGGSYSFLGAENFLRGRPSEFSVQSPDSDTVRNWRQWGFATYLQDDYKIRENMTLNLGLRWEFVTGPSERNGKGANLLNLTDPAMTLINPFFEISKKNIEPRVGFAWDVFGGGKTALRAGAGIFHDMPWGIFYDRSGGYNPPFAIRGRVQAQDFATRVLPFPETTAIIPLLGRQPSLFVQPFDTQAPTKYAWNVSFQQELFAGIAATVSYVGSRSAFQQRVMEANTRIPTRDANGRLFFPPGDSALLNPTFDSLSFRQSDGNSRYNALQVNVERRFRDRMAFQVAYTLAKSEDDSSEQFIGVTSLESQATEFGNFYDKAYDFGPSLFDVRHNVSANFTYELPTATGGGALGSVVSGWQLSGLLRVQSGAPFTPVINFNNSRNGRSVTGQNRPDWAPGRGPSNTVLGGPDQYFDPTAFGIPPPGYYGRVGRNVLRGPWLTTLDGALVKKIALGGNRGLQVRIEGFNLTNRPNFSTPRQAVLNRDGTPFPNAGRITRTTTDSREFQFAIKFLF